MSETYLGQTNVFWAAMEAVGSILAFSLTFALLLWGKIKKWLFSPRIKITNKKLQVLKGKDVLEITLHYNIKNVPVLQKYGQDILGLSLSSWLSEKDIPLAIDHNDNPSFYLPSMASIDAVYEFKHPLQPKVEYSLTLQYKTDNIEISRKKIKILYKPDPVHDAYVISIDL